MLTNLFFPEVPGVRVDRAWREGPTLHLALRATRRWARCPLCQRRSRRPQSTYERTLADLPCAGERVTVHVLVRRFVCRVRGCRRKIFAERLPDLVAPFARRTGRLSAHLLRTAFALGGEGGARHRAAEGIPVSARTLLRLIRAAPLPVAGPVHAVGIDDWARRKGRTYGTILVNLVTHTVIDLLPDRTAETLAAWLRPHPEIAVASRDRAGAYAEGIRLGAPQAIQTADRFHLRKNASEALERYLTRQHGALRQAAAAPDRASATLSAVVPADNRPPGPPGEAPEQRARRVARYEEVRALRAQGVSLRTIAGRVGLSERTVKRWLHAGRFPERRRRSEQPGQVAPFVAYRRERWAQGCHNATRLWRDLQARGYTGCYGSVAALVASWRGPRYRHRGQTKERPGQTTEEEAYTPRRVCWLLLRPLDHLTTEEQAYLTRLYHCCPQVAVAEALVEEFASVRRDHDVEGLYTWRQGAEMSGIKEMVAFARGIRLDQAAVEAAVRLEWSNGQVEGKVNKLKTIKREHYGRAGFDLLRRFVLHAA